MPIWMKVSVYRRIEPDIELHSLEIVPDPHKRAAETIEL